MLYQCKRCGYQTNHVGNLKTHLNKKKTCKPVYADVDRALLLEELSTPNGKKNFVINITDQIIPFDKLNDPEDFVQKMQEENNQLKHENVALMKENAELKTKLYALQTTGGVGGNVTNNNTNNNNIQINIIHNFGQENTKYISQDFLMETVNRVYDAIPTLLKHIHFNPEHPENHNVKFPNKRDKYMLVRRSDEWKHENKRDVLDSLVRKAHYYLVDNVPDETIEDQFKRSCVQKQRRFMDQEDPEVIKDVQTRVEIMILDARSEHPDPSTSKSTED